MNLEKLVIKVNTALAALPRNIPQITAQTHAQNLIKNITVGHQTNEIFGSFLGSCPFKILKKSYFYVDLTSNANGRWRIANITMSMPYGGDDRPHNKVEAINENFRRLNYPKLAAQSGIIDTFDFSHLEKINFGN